MSGTLEANTSSSRKNLIERLASLRIQSSSPSPSQSQPQAQTSLKAPESPRYIPRSTQSTITTKSKFYQQQQQQESNDLLASPTIGRRRKLTGLTGISLTSSKNTANSVKNTVNSTVDSVKNTANSIVDSVKSTVTSAPSTSFCPIDSPKYFPKQKFIEIEEKSISKFPELEELERKHSSVKEVVTSFIDSYNILTKSSTSTSTNFHLKNLNTSFAALQMDLKAAVSQLNEMNSLKDEINSLKDKIKSLKDEITSLNSEIKDLNSEITSLNNEIKDLKSENLNLKLKVANDEEEAKNKDEQLKITLNQISEVKLAFDKEKENVEFLQNYMEEIIQLKDEAEQKILTLERDEKITSNSLDLLKENESLKETIKLLEMERKSSKNVCEQALKVLDSGDNVEALKQEIKLKQAEIEKLKGREQHFKESNEIFQQKLLLLTEENRKLKGQRPLNHY